VVGEAVVRAVQLERSGPKGPRLLVSAEVAKALKKNSPKKHLLDIHAESSYQRRAIASEAALTNRPSACMTIMSSKHLREIAPTRIQHTGASPAVRRQRV